MFSPVQGCAVENTQGTARTRHRRAVCRGRLATFLWRDKERWLGLAEGQLDSS